MTQDEIMEMALKALTTAKRFGAFHGADWAFDEIVNAVKDLESALEAHKELAKQEQRKPLTGEKIMDLCAEQWASHPVEVARIIEAAHGIK